MFFRSTKTNGRGPGGIHLSTQCKIQLHCGIKGSQGAKLSLMSNTPPKKRSFAPQPRNKGEFVTKLYYCPAEPHNRGLRESRDPLERGWMGIRGCYGERCLTPKALYKLHVFLRLA